MIVLFGSRDSAEAEARPDTVVDRTSQHEAGPDATTLASPYWGESTASGPVTTWPVYPSDQSAPTTSTGGAPDPASEMSFAPNDGGPPGGAAAGHWDVNLTLDNEHPSMMVAIPLNPLTESVILTLRATGSEGGVFPVLGPAMMFNPDGTPIEPSGPGSGPGQNPYQTMMEYFRTAQAGGQLDVQVMAAGGSSELDQSSTQLSAAATAGTTQSSGWNVSFVLDVQRQDSASSAQDAATSLVGRAAIGTLIAVSAPQTGAFLTSSSDPAPAAESADASAQTQAATTPLVSEAPPAAVVEPDLSDAFNLRVSTGPLASRSATPLGPTLASIDAEATQPVDRHERALSQEIDGLGSDDQVPSAAWRNGGSDQETAMYPGRRAHSSEAADQGQPVVAIAGHGGLPIIVTASGHGQRVVLADLWATLPRETELASAEPGLQQAPIAPVTTDVERTTDPKEVPDYVKAALGLALGVGLTSGPLFRDLVASLPRRVPGWIVALRPIKSRPPSAASPTRRSRGIGAWLRHLVVRS